VKTRDALALLGVRANMIYEAIVTTYSSSGDPNAAPMGFSLTAEAPYRIVLKPFKSTQTYSNLTLKKCGAINITRDPMLFLEAAFPEAVDAKRIVFERCVNVDAPRLEEADGYVEFNVEKIEDETPERAKGICLPVSVMYRRTHPRAFTRAETALLEAVVHATRVKVFVDMGDPAKGIELANRIKYYAELIERVAPRTGWSEAARWLSRKAEEAVYGGGRGV